MREKARLRDHRQAGIGETADHPLRLCQRKERVGLAPDELHRHGDPPVDRVEVVHETVVEAAQHPHRGLPTLGRPVQRAEKELIKLAVEQGRVQKRIAEHEAVATQPRPPDHPAETRGRPRQMSDREERPEAPADMAGDLGVDERHRPQARVAGDGVTRDHPAAVVPDHRHLSEPEEIEHPADAANVLHNAERRRRVEPTGPRAG